MIKATVNNQTFEFENAQLEDGQAFDIVKVEEGSFHIIKNKKSYKAYVTHFDAQTKLITLQINGTDYEVAIKDKFDLLLDEMGIDMAAANKINDIKAPMPGLILQVLVEEGATIQKGDQLLILEAMKMENVLKSPGDGVIKRIVAQQGKAVEKNEVLIELE